MIVAKCQQSLPNAKAAFAGGSEETSHILNRIKKNKIMSHLNFELELHYINLSYSIDLKPNL